MAQTDNTNPEAKMTATATRTDVHRPSQMNPADYKMVGILDLHEMRDGRPVREEERYDLDFDLLADLGLYAGDPIPESPSEAFVSLPRSRPGVGVFDCDHCGGRRAMVLGIFVHLPTKTITIVGRQCARRFAADTREAADRFDAAERRARLRPWLEASADHVRIYEWLKAAEIKGEIVRRRVAEGDIAKADDVPPSERMSEFQASLLRRIRNKGSLTPMQVAVAVCAIEEADDADARWRERKDREAADAERRATMPPVPTGAVEITGRIVSARFQESIYGEMIKCLVETDEGWRVWGTMPKAIDEAMANDEGVAIQFDQLADYNLRVRFTATVEQSDDDPTFGFFKRPRKAEVISAEPIG